MWATLSFITFHVIFHLQSSSSQDSSAVLSPPITRPFLFPISVCLGILRAAPHRATPQEHWFEFATAGLQRKRLIYLRDALETPPVLSTLGTGNIGAEEEQCFWRAVDSFVTKRSFGVNLDLGWAFAPALVEAWYVGNSTPASRRSAAAPPPGWQLSCAENTAWHCCRYRRIS
jgi:hypothetical protein